LDNAITLYGKFRGSNYQTKSGYLINYNDVKDIRYDSNRPQTWKLNYSGVEIVPEILTEHLLFIDKTEGDYDYLVYEGQKIYYDKNRVEEGNETKYFYYQDYNKLYITRTSTNEEVLKYLENRTDSNNLYSTSAFEFYYNAYNFSKEVAGLTRGIKQENAVDANGNKINFDVDANDEDIFVATKNNDPLISGSTFNENRMVVIKESIKTNLITAISQFNIYSGNNYEFALPELSDIAWNKLTNSIAVAAFMQGIPIGHKYYNNYCVITNNNNEETINKENIYILTEVNGKREYHLPGCKKLIETDEYKTKTTVPMAFSSLSFTRQTVRISEGDYMYFYPQTRENNEYLTSCYHCIVSAADMFNIDHIITGTIFEKDQNWEDKKTHTVANNTRLKNIRATYIRALARERYDLYQTNLHSFNN